MQDIIEFGLYTHVLFRANVRIEGTARDPPRLLYFPGGRYGLPGQAGRKLQLMLESLGFQF